MRPKLHFHALDHGCMLAFLAYAASAVMTPVCLVILVQEFGFGLTAGGTMEVLRTLALSLTLLCSGFIAAKLGKVHSLSAGLVTMAAGLLLFSQSPSLPLLLVASFLAGLGAGVVEALINPLVQEMHPEDSGRYLNFVNAFWSVGVLFSTLVTGDLLDREVSWRPIVAGFALLSAMAAAVLYMLRGSEPRTSATQADVWRSKIAIFRHPQFPPFMLLMFLAGTVEGGLTFWSASFVQLEFASGPRAGGFATAMFAAGMITGRIFWGLHVPQHGLRKALLVSVMLGVLPCALLPLAVNPSQAFILLFLAGISIAPLWPVLQSLAAERMKVDSTSLFILLSCGGIPGFAAAAWLIGWTSDLSGVGTGLWVVPIGMLVLGAVLAARRTLAR